MIRDQFQNNKKVTAKEERKKLSMGERNYYVKKIGFLQDVNKSLGVSMIITTVILTIAFAFVLLLYVVTKDAEKVEERYELWKFIVRTVCFGVSFLFTVAWYAFIKPANMRKITHYRHELERLNAVNVSKAMANYTLYGEDYKNEQIKKHRESIEESARIAREKQESETANKQKDTDSDGKSE